MALLFLPLVRAVLGCLFLFLSHFMLQLHGDMHEAGGLSSHKNNEASSFSERAISALRQCRLPEMLPSKDLFGYHTARIDSNNSIGFRHIPKNRLLYSENACCSHEAA